MRRFCILFLTSLLLIQCKVPPVDLESGVDRDIVIINLEEGDRSFIAELVLKADSCKPAVLVVNAFFQTDKGLHEDSMLIASLQKAKNDLVIYNVDPVTGLEKNSTISKFTKWATGKGIIRFQRSGGLVTGIVPIESIDRHVHENVALKIVKLWKQGFKHSLRENEMIPIHYIHDNAGYYCLPGSIFKSENIDTSFFKDKIIILGYLGLGNDDKHYTPIRFAQEYPGNVPDTYGSVILANAVRTLLEYKK